MKIVKLLLVSFLVLVSCKETTTKEAVVATESASKKLTKPVFEKLSATQTGIAFSNTLQENVGTKENLFDYDFFYNGAGVGIEDLNNDGLKDVFFCGNQQDNALYINTGNLSFVAVSDNAGINVNKQWATGVTFVDINQDGWMDVYVSQGGPFPAAQRKNLLYINNKDLTFTERAASYGLDDAGISSQAAFFDYDNDGDLDCIVMNENELYGIDPQSFYRALASESLLEKNTSNLYENVGGSFKKVTKKAGLLLPSFGLGLSVSDVNNDGWLDIYIANDYYVPDAYYVNNKNGTFTNVIKRDLNQISFYGMGVDIADINNDSHQDIFVLDMASSDHVRSKTLMASMNEDRFNMLVEDLGMPHQYMFNSLQLNMGNNKFQNIAQLTKMAKTDWSWAALLADFDNDALKDVYVTNGYRKYALDNDFRKQVVTTQKQYDGKVPLAVKQALYDKMIPGELPNIMYKNEGALSFKNVTSSWGMAIPSFSNGASYADLDNDGDLDLVVNNIDAEAFVFKNTTSDFNKGNFLRVNLKGKTSEPFAKVTLIHNGEIQQVIESKRVRGYLSATDNTAHFGLADQAEIDLVRVEWLSGVYEEKYHVKANSMLQFDEEEAKMLTEKVTNTPRIQAFQKSGIDFVHEENEYHDFSKEILLPYKQSTLGPYITKGDLNNDGKEDVFIGGAAGQAAAIYLQTENGFSKLVSNLLDRDKKYEDMDVLIFDFDGDQDQDIYVVSGGNSGNLGAGTYNDRLYINDGKANFSRYESAALKNFANSGKSITSIDFDQDGDADLLVGNRILPQRYPKHAPSTIYENDNGVLKDVTASRAPELADFGIINKIIATDFNNDGWEDFIAVGEWTSIGFFKNTNGTFKNVSKEMGLDNEKGWWFTIAETDINNDGLKDYVVGNVGYNIKFKASKEKPFKVFANDFDANGTLDIVLSNDYNGEYVPVRGKECSSQQMPFISQKFEKYEDFAKASLSDIYGQKLYASYNREVTTFGSIVLLNQGSGNFSKAYLPQAAQAFPLLDYEVLDYNNDGFEDLLVVGNIYNTEVETPRLDGGTGFILLSNKKDNYLVLDAKETGLYIDGNVKSVQLIQHKGNDEELLIAGRNNDKVSVFKVVN